MLFSGKLTPDLNFKSEEYLYNRYLEDKVNFLAHLKSPEYFFKGISTNWSKYSTKEEAKLVEDTKHNDNNSIQNKEDCRYKEENPLIRIASISCKRNNQIIDIEIKERDLSLKVQIKFKHTPRTCNYPHTDIKFSIITPHIDIESLSNSQSKILMNQIKFKLNTLFEFTP